MNTAGTFNQGKPQPDGQIFLSAVDGVGGTATPVGTLGLLGRQIAASQTGALVQMNASGLLLRTGVLQSQALGMAASQEAFGTKASTPGPSAVSGTSGPGAFGSDQVIPPIVGARMPTIAGPTSGALKKGIQINWIDFIYQVQAVAATSVGASAGIINAALGADVTATQVSLFNATALSAAVNSNSTTKVHRQRITIASPAMIVSDASILALVMSVTTPSGSTVGIVGALLGVSYNFN